MNMEEAIRNGIRESAVRKMKNPTILMNDKDLETFIKQVENQVNNFKVGKYPKYEGIPIISRKQIEQGKFIIYNQAVDKLFN